MNFDSLAVANWREVFASIDASIGGSKLRVIYTQPGLPLKFILTNQSPFTMQRVEVLDRCVDMFFNWFKADGRIVLLFDLAEENGD